MATTPKGIFYPEGGTNVDFLSIFQTIANSIDEALGDFTYDSGWIDVPNSQMLNGWNNYNSTGFRVKYRKIGRWVSVDGLIRYGTEGTAMFVLPSGFRPSGSYLFCSLGSPTLASNGGHKIARINVVASGEVSQVGNIALGNGFLSLSEIGFYID